MSDGGNVLKVPNQALHYRPNASGPPSDHSKDSATVWLVGEGGRPAPVAVKLGTSDENSTALLEGQLEEGQQLIVGVANSQKRRSYFGVRLRF